MDEEKSDEDFTYTKADHAAWLSETQFNEQSAAAAARVLSRLIELMLSAAARPGVKKSIQVFNALLQVIEKTKNEFHLEKHIGAQLRQRHSTETRCYTVEELRGNDLLAKMVGFKDDSKLQDDEVLPMTKAVGWFPAADVFNVWWQHRELLNEIRRTQESELSEDAKAKLEQIDKLIDSELDASLKGIA